MKPGDILAVSDIRELSRQYSRCKVKLGFPVFLKLNLASSLSAAQVGWPEAWMEADGFSREAIGF